MSWLGVFGGLAIPIHRLLEPGVFEPEQIATMARVFEDVLTTLGLVDREDPMTTLVAKKLIELARTGEHDPARLKERTLQAFGTRDSRPS
jgi:hypothetical protein